LATGVVGLGVGARVAVRQVNALAKEAAKAAPEAAQKAASAAGKEGSKAGAEGAGKAGAEAGASASEAGWFDFSRKFYEGGFQPELTKREAALILGVRERASKERILERYRVLMRKNHPDRGGSPLLSMKINEAKDLMSKTARSDRGRRSFHSFAHRHNHSINRNTNHTSSTNTRSFSSTPNATTPYSYSAHTHMYMHTHSHSSGFRAPSSVNKFARDVLRQ
jgi:DnaJ homolog subfamily C member 19